MEAPKPIYRAPPFRCADRWTRDNPICRPGLAEKRSDEEWFRAPTVALMQRLADEVPGLTIFDPLQALCDPDFCRAVTAEGRPLYFDADHLSRYGNEVVHASFADHLARIRTGSR